MFRTCALLVLAGFGLTSTARAEKVPLSPAELKSTATHIITGDVAAVYERTETVRNWRYTRYVAEVRVATTEKGDGVKAGDLVYVRYWNKAWIGAGQQPPDTAGHRGTPAVGETHRIYMAKNAYDGFGTTKDGGFNVIGANGFERLTAEPRK
jgi:hypothetical protein